MTFIETMPFEGKNMNITPGHNAANDAGNLEMQNRFAQSWNRNTAPAEVAEDSASVELDDDQCLGSVVLGYN